MKCKELFTSIQETVSEECVLAELSQLDDNDID